MKYILVLCEFYARLLTLTISIPFPSNRTLMMPDACTEHATSKLSHLHNRQSLHNFAIPLVAFLAKAFEATLQFNSKISITRGVKNREVQHSLHLHQVAVCWQKLPGKCKLPSAWRVSVGEYVPSYL